MNRKDNSLTCMNITADRKTDDNPSVQLSILELCLILLVNIWYMWTYTHQVCTYGSLTFDLLSDLATFQYHRYPAACHRAMTLMC